MARKTKRSSSRKIKRTHKRKSHHKRTHRRGGAAPVNYHLSGSWPSRMSLGQGGDYFKYHEGQHGGGSLAMSPYPGSVMSPGLPQNLRMAAHIGGIDKAMADISGLRDPPYDQGATVGGRRRKHRKGSKSHKRRHTRKHRQTRRNKRRSGGALGYAPFPSAGMLLSSPKQYAQAGLNPEWKTDVAFTAAKVRDTQ